ncbi:cytochrome c [Psychrobacter sp. LV10R520-6]|uniref:cytochrome c n=1 Tax=Psychrobacter sp. LV10R520-6 TaxID=1415574 RepID=UPI0024CD2216|nr:cytochrome c [Psychrobacter sp. LV10R520-6]SNT70144.1 Cytochrome c, mono- and diheme variants [Psychrobacter sp. LV10R520-6]
MKKWPLIILVVAVIGLALAFVIGQLLPNMRTTSSDLEVNITDPALIKQGAYVARTADCVACHTTLDGEAYAGGLPMLTPLGAIYSTNITPDKTTGIGNYSFDDFKNAVKHGVRIDNSALYPAMPYPSYQIMPDDDMAAMYAYFMSDVKAVNQPNQKSELPPVMNWRWPLSYWQAIFAPKRSFTPETDDAVLVRGQYLIEGPGHCGSCHTERGIGFQEVALTNADSEEYLSGAVIDGWRAKSLRGEHRGLGTWNTAELSEFFKTGRTDTTAAFGAMADVVEHSTQYMTDNDLNAMSAYLKTLTPAPNKEVVLPEKKDLTTQKLLDGNYDSRGAILYAEYCQVCHRADGKGVPRIFPALDANSAVYAKNADSVLQITLGGGRMPETPYDRMAFTMPEFTNLADADIAEVVNYVRNSWTNQAPEIGVNDVVKMRAFLAKKPKTATDIAPDLSINAATQGANHE